jgi:hypothetical protein
MLVKITAWFITTFQGETLLTGRDLVMEIVTRHFVLTLGMHLFHKWPGRLAVINH